MNSHHKKKVKAPHAFFPFGVHYYCAPTPLPDEWDHDLEQIAQAGYTHIQFRTLWRWHERIRSDFVWDDLDQLFALAHKYKLKVILKPMLENAPDWVFSELEGSRVGFHGVPLSPFAMNSAYYAGGFMPCFDNPQVIKAATHFITALVARYQRHPSLWYYDAWNEPRSRPMSQCCCQHSAESYREWLRSRFGSIEELNRRLYKAWTSYETLVPPTSNTDLVEMFCWRQWAAFAVSKQVQFVVEAIRRVDPNAQVLVHSGGCSVTRDPACDACDDLLNAEKSDRYGFSLNISDNPENFIQWNETEFQSSWLRRVDSQYWCHEFYPRGPKWRKPTQPKILTQQIWLAIASGCSALTFWEYRSARMGIMSSGFGMRTADGSKTRTSDICDSIAAVLHKHGAELANTRRLPARIALLHCRQSDLLMRLQKMQIWMGDAQQVMPDVDYVYKKSLRAAHAAYQYIGEDVDWVVPGDALDKVSLLHVTAAEIIDEQTAKWLRDFAESGGVLVIEYPFACRDEKTWLYTEDSERGLTELLGCKESWRVALEDKDNEVASFTNGLKIRAKEWRFDLTLSSGEPFAHWQDGKIAAIKNHYGKGVVYTFGLNVSLSFDDISTHPLLEILKWLRTESLPSSPSRLCNQVPGVWCKERHGEDWTILFCLNLAKTPKQIQLAKPPTAVWYLNEGQISQPAILQLEAEATAVLKFARAFSDAPRDDQDENGRREDIPFQCGR